MSTSAWKIGYFCLFVQNDHELLSPSSSWKINARKPITITRLEYPINDVNDTIFGRNISAINGTNIRFDDSSWTRIDSNSDLNVQIIYQRRNELRISQWRWEVSSWSDMIRKEFCCKEKTDTISVQTTKIFFLIPLSSRDMSLRKEEERV